MKHAFPFTLCLFISFALVTLVGCNRGVRSDASAARPPLTPAAISSSAQVVKVIPSPVEINVNGSADAAIALSILPGYHINANPATFSYLIATEVSTGKAEGITVGAPGYPAAVKKKFQFAEQPLAVYEGEAPIKLNLRAEKNAGSGSRSLPITVRVQACDEEQCFPPATISSTISVMVK